MGLVFFELQEWEEETLKENFPDATFSQEKLTFENVDNFKNAAIISTFIYSDLTKEVMDKLPNLKFIATRSTGYDHIDINAAKSKNIIVSNIPEYGTRTVAEHTFALILTLTRKIYQSINQAKHFDFDHANIRGIDLYEKTLGIVGLGKIGKEVLMIGKSFGMKILVYTKHQDPQLTTQLGFKYANDLNELLRNSDIVTLHLPYTKETHHIINKNNIGFLKKGSYLINTARGGLIETEALVSALEEGRLTGVGLDVLEDEEELSEEVDVLTETFSQKVDLKTLVLDHVLINHPKVIITPHNAFNSQEALKRITTTTIENIKAFLNNNPANQVG